MSHHTLCRVKPLGWGFPKQKAKDKIIIFKSFPSYPNVPHTLALSIVKLEAKVIVNLNTCRS
jgi:hypothetical protein